MRHDLDSAYSDPPQDYRKVRDTSFLPGMQTLTTDVSSPISLSYFGSWQPQQPCALARDSLETDRDRHVENHAHTWNVVT